MSWRVIALLALSTVALLTSGCGGLSASGGVSPATFLLPGFGQVGPSESVGEPAAPFVGDAPARSAAQPNS